MERRYRVVDFRFDGIWVDFFRLICFIKLRNSVGRLCKLDGNWSLLFMLLFVSFFLNVCKRFVIVFWRRFFVEFKLLFNVFLIVLCV